VVAARKPDEPFFFGVSRARAEYGVEPLPDTSRLINPPWRAFDSQIRSQNALLSRESARLAEIHLAQQLEPEQVQAYELGKGQLQQAIEKRCQESCNSRPSAKQFLNIYILVKDLPEQDRFQQLRAEKKHFLDTIKLCLSGRNSPGPACPG
jgi:hypothetical protein